ncbi:hypothetical protein IJ00_20450 [Calothrix sp. 336/3]|nr:hypothetical protein IJ00_20450 [Calothrix sp. 336/3]
MRNANIIKTINKTNQQDDGFTLIEVLVVILMVGVLSAIAAPSWLGFVNRQRVSKANDAVLGALQAAQTEAKKKKLSYSVSFRNNNKSPEIAIYPGSTLPTNPVWKPLGDNISFKPGEIIIYTNLHSTNSNTKASANITYSTAGSGTITFDYMGTLTDVTLGTAGGSSEQLGLKIAVASPVSKSSLAASNERRCVILDTLIGGVRIAKNSDCQ